MVGQSIFGGQINFEQLVQGRLGEGAFSLTGQIYFLQRLDGSVRTQKNEMAESNSNERKLN